MKFRKSLDDLFSTGSSVKVLRVMSGAWETLSVRRVADWSGVDHTTASAILKRMEKLRVVDFQQAGKTRLYRLDEDNLYVSRIILPVFRLESEILKGLIKELAASFGKLAVSVILFGSVARAEEQENSDLDICVVVKGKRELKMAEKFWKKEISRISDETGTIPTILTITRADFRQKYAKHDPLLISIVRDGVHYHGLTIPDLVAKP